MAGHRKQRDRGVKPGTIGALPGGTETGDDADSRSLQRPRKESAVAGRAAEGSRIAPQRIAVLPPAILPDCPAIDGLGLKIARCILEGLRAAGQASVLGFVEKGSPPNDVTIRYLCRTFDAEMLLLGQAWQLAHRVRITLELWDGWSGERLWSGSYECDPQLVGEGFAAMCREITLRATAAAAARRRL